MLDASAGLSRSGGVSVSRLWLPTRSLWHRELVRFFRQRQRVVSSLVTPITLWLMLGLGLNRSFVPAGSEAAVVNDAGYLLYFLPGAATMIVLFTAIFSTITVIEDRREGLLQSVLVSPASRLAIVLGKVLGGATVAMIHGLVFLAVAMVGMGLWPGFGAMVQAVGIMALLAVGLTALGLCVAWPMDSTAGFHAVMMLFLMPMWFISGAAFPVTGAAAPMRVVMLANPLTYGQAALTESLTGGRVSVGLPAPLSPTVALVIFALACAAVVALAVRLVAQPRKDGLA